MTARPGLLSTTHYAGRSPQAYQQAADFLADLDQLGMYAVPDITQSLFGK